METKTVLITDVNADAGMQCVQTFLSKGYHVSAMFSGNHPDDSNVEWIEAEILDPESYFPFLSNVHLIVHNATMISFKTEDHQKLKAVNTIATRDLVNNALLAGVKEMIFMSSAYTLIRSAEPQLISTTAVGNPVFLNHYTQTMFQAELEMHRAAAEGMKICILNCALVKDQTEAEPSAFGRLMHTISKYPQLFHQQLPYISTDDLKQHILKVVDENYGDGNFYYFQKDQTSKATSKTLKYKMEHKKFHC
ncbi:MAG: SDR family oxidoreductase [Saprospiraceae bacterium]|nr:SDR family oxidoreductase [Saprospiraceae bacterium]